MAQLLIGGCGLVLIGGCGGGGWFLKLHYCEKINPGKIECCVCSDRLQVWLQQGSLCT